MDDLTELTLGSVGEGALEAQFADHLETAAGVFAERHKYQETSDGEVVVKVALDVEIRQAVDHGVRTTKTIVGSHIKLPKREPIGRYVTFRDGRFQTQRDPAQTSLPGTDPDELGPGAPQGGKSQ